MAVEIYETNGRLLSVNDTWVEFWDLEKETVVDFNILDDPECERTGLASAFKEAQQGRMRILHDVLYDAEASGLTGGRKRWISSKMYPILDQEREVKNIILTYDDITERKNLEEQLRQSQKMEAIGQLSGGVAHDFNNLLTGIIGNLSLAEMKAPIEIQDFLINAKKATSRAGELVRKLLAFSRKSQIELKPVDLNQTTKDTFHLARQTIDRRIDMDLQISEEHLHILGDDAQVNSLIMNLLLNARDAITEVMDEERGGDTFVITVRTYIQPGEVYAVISVSDTGIGMDKETQEHIFEPFYTTKEIGKGTGLGLTSVYGIVKQHDGRIEIESELGEGTTFKVYLPIAKEKVSTTEEEPGEISRGTETILIIDDEAMIRDLGKNILEQWGYTVLLASEGQEGLNVFHQNQERIDLVILDLSMPKMSGREVLAQIHAVSPEAKVAISSGYSPEGIEKEELERRGATGFLSKPYKLFEMLRTVRNLLDEPRS